MQRLAQNTDNQPPLYEHLDSVMRSAHVHVDTVLVAQHALSLLAALSASKYLEASEKRIRQILSHVRYTAHHFFCASDGLSHCLFPTTVYHKSAFVAVASVAAATVCQGGSERSDDAH